MPKKPQALESACKDAKAVQTEGYLACTPLLASFLADLFHEGEDGQPSTPREPSTMLIYPGKGYFRVLLKDPSAGVMLQCAVDRWEDITMSLEMLLASDSPPWVTDPYAAGRVTRKKK